MVSGLSDNFIYSLLLGVVQGITEFLPISSSGHLLLAKNLLGIHDMPLLYGVFFHFATVLAVCTLYRKDLIIIAKDLIQFLLQSIGFCRSETVQSDLNSGTRLCMLLIIGTLPAVFVGGLYADFFRNVFSNPNAALINFTITGVILISTILMPREKKILTVLSSLLIGVAQSFALFPGISRSGITISAGLWLGIKPEEVVKYSFLLSVPVILGANILEFSNVSMQILQNHIWYLIAGGITSYVSGLVAIVLVLKVIKIGRFFWFGVYCLLVGTTGLLFI